MVASFPPGAQDVLVGDVVDCYLYAFLIVYYASHVTSWRKSFRVVFARLAVVVSR